MPAATNHLSTEELRALIRDTVRETVSETFVRLGLEVDDPIEVQKDFQHLREWRLTTASLKAKAMLTAVGLVASGVLAALWMGIKGSIRS